MITQTLNAENHKNFEIYKYPGLDHWDAVHKTSKDSFGGKVGKRENRISQQIIDWAKGIDLRSWRD